MKFTLKAGQGFLWHAEDGYAALQGYSDPDGTIWLYALYLGDHHRKLTATEAHDELCHRLVILGRKPDKSA